MTLTGKAPRGRKSRAIALRVFPVVVLAVCAVVLIFGKSLTSLGGYLTQDSAAYLELAEALLDGEGFSILNDGVEKAQRVPFATWPVGYPGLIALVSAVLGVTTFTASKLLGASALVLSMIAVSLAFGRIGPTLALVFLFAGPLETFTYSWSEGPFILLMVLFAITLSRFMENGGTTLATGILIFLSIALFLTRYIGIFLLAPFLLVAACKFLQRDVVSALKLVTAAGATTLFATAYLFRNKLQTGFLTGVPRPPAEETAAEFLSDLGVALFREIVLPIPYWVSTELRHNIILLIVLITALYLLVQARRATPGAPSAHHRHLTRSFLLVGLTYLAAIIAARSSSQFDPFGFRLLSPGTTLVLLGSFAWCAGRYPALRAPLHGALLLMAGMSVLVHAVMLNSSRTPGGYVVAQEQRAEAYAALPEGAIVLYGIHHLRYQRPDVHIFRLHPGTPLADKADFDAMIARLDPTRPVYLEMGYWLSDINKLPAPLRRFIESCDASSYLNEVQLGTNGWMCLPLAQKP